MNRLIILLVLILLNSCSNKAMRVKPSQTGVDPTFTPYIDSYSYIINSKNKSHKYIYDQRIKKLSMNFTILEGNVIGRCHWLLNGEFEIEIDQGYWRIMSFSSKQFLVYHELEHCIRFRMHTHEDVYKSDFWRYMDRFARFLGLIPNRGYFADGCPDSIMHPSDVGEQCHTAHYDEYIDEIINYKDDKL